MYTYNTHPWHLRSNNKTFLVSILVCRSPKRGFDPPFAEGPIDWMRKIDAITNQATTAGLCFCYFKDNYCKVSGNNCSLKYFFSGWRCRKEYSSSSQRFSDVWTFWWGLSKMKVSFIHSFIFTCMRCMTWNGRFPSLPHSG